MREVLGRRHLHVARRVGHQAHGHADALHQRRVVGGADARRCAAAYARSSTTRGNPCGVWARQSPSRGTVRTTRVASSAAACLSVSLTRTAATAPSPARACAMTASMTAPPDERARGVVHQHHRALRAERREPGGDGVGALGAAGHD